MNAAAERGSGIEPSGLCAYVVQCGDFNDALVFAYDQKSARDLGALHISWEDWSDITVSRAPELDRYLNPQANVSYAETRSEVLRLAGWQKEDEYRCTCCDLAGMDLYQYEVCDHCELCPECAQESDEKCEVCGRGGSEAVGKATTEAAEKGGAG